MARREMVPLIEPRTAGARAVSVMVGGWVFSHGCYGCKHSIAPERAKWSWVMGITHDRNAKKRPWAGRAPWPKERAESSRYRRGRWVFPLGISANRDRSKADGP